MNISFNDMTKIVCFLYLSYRLYMILFRGRILGFWNCIFVSRKYSNNSMQSVTADASPDVVGETTSVYLEDPISADIMPVRSEDLEHIDLSDDDVADISTDEVENTLIAPNENVRPDESELYDVDQVVPDDEFCRGMTYDQIANAVAVVSNGTAVGENASDAARVLYEVRNTDLFNFFTEQVADAERVEHLIRKYVDLGETASPKDIENPTEVGRVDFDWGKYV